MEKQQKRKIDGEKMRAENASQRSRGKYLKPAPEKLAALVELANLLPPDSLELDQMHPEALKEQAEATVHDPSYKVSARWLKMSAGYEEWFPPSVWELAKLIQDCIRNLSSELHSYVFLGSVTEDNIRARASLPEESAISRYENLWYSTLRLRRMARLAKAESGKYVGVSIVYSSPARLPLHDSIDAQGFVRVYRDLFTEAIEGTGVEAARIRECLICQRIFWAGRIDAWQCGAAKCKSALSSRLNRNPELRVLYNKARRTKRQKQREAHKRTQSTTKKGR